MGTLPKHATHWGLIKQRHDGAFEKLSQLSADGMIAVEEWPIADLTLERIASTWGPGTYKVTFWCPRGQGGRKYLNTGREFVVAQPSPKPRAAADTPAAPAAPTGLETAIAFMNMADSRVSNQLGAIAQFATLMQPRGIDPALVALMQQQQEAQAKMLQALERLSNRVAAIEAPALEAPRVHMAEVVPPVAPIVKAVAKKPSWDTLKDSLLSYAIENPGEALQYAKQVVTTIEGIAKPPAPPARPRPRAAEVATPEAPPPTLPPPGPGLNGFVSESAKAAS